jgi:aryl-alcohol dehydrogenase-like predicted oxidoreductase
VSVLIPNGTTPTTSLGFGTAYVTGGIETKRSRRLLDAAFDGGIRHFDTAPSYGNGRSEDVLGLAMQNRRHQITIASKVGISRPASRPVVDAIRAAARPFRSLVPARTRAAANEVAPGRPTSRRVFDAKFVEHSITETLKRLRTDYLDIYLLHEAEASDITPSLLAVLDRLRTQGRARSIGVASVYRHVSEIARLHPGFFDVFQYSRSALDPESIRPEGARLAVTHRALLRAYGPLRNWLRASPTRAEQVSRSIGIDLRSDEKLADILVAAAMVQNENGIVLVGSRQASRAARLGTLIGDPVLQMAASKFVEELAVQPDLPLASET